MKRNTCEQGQKQWGKELERFWEIVCKASTLSFQYEAVCKLKISPLLNKLEISALRVQLSGLIAVQNLYLICTCPTSCQLGHWEQRTQMYIYPIDSVEQGYEGKVQK